MMEPWSILSAGIATNGPVTIGTATIGTVARPG